MGIYDREYYRDEPKGFSLSSLTGGRSIVMTLIMINVAVFILDAISGSSAASDFLKLSVTDAAKPWFWFRFLTCGFAHGTPGHIFGNMIGLFFFGRVIEAVYGSHKFLWMYLTAILVGSVAWMITAYLAGAIGHSVLGASGGVAAVVLLFCMKFPHQKVYLLFLPFIGFPAWVLGVVLVGADVFGMSGFRPESNVAFIVHLAGASYAYLFYRTQWELSQLIPGLSGGRVRIKNPFKSSPKLQVHNPGPSRDEILATKADEVLKKLHLQGEASLTPRERKILEDYSRIVKQKNR